MNTTTTSFSSEHSWLSNGPSRRGSTESVLSIQGKETDFVRDTSDTDTFGSDRERDVEYEPVTEPEDDAPFDGDSSGQTDNDIISTKVIKVCVGDDGDLEFADSEQTDSEDSDSEIDLYDYWQCAQCRTVNNNPLYRYCEKCFKVRKDTFPPRPKRRHKHITKKDPETVPRSLSQDSGIESAFYSQEFSSQDALSQACASQSTYTDVVASQVVASEIVASQVVASQAVSSQVVASEVIASQAVASQVVASQVVASQVVASNSNETTCERDANAIAGRSQLKRRAESADRYGKRAKIDRADSDSDTDTNRCRKSRSEEPEVKKLVKTVSDPSLTVERSETSTVTVKSIISTLKDKLASDMCIVCCVEPKSGVFVHGRIAHICCCYKCAVKVWAKAKRCPVCNCKVSNVLKAVVM